jgi:hypothetical protein
MVKVKNAISGDRGEGVNDKSRFDRGNPERAYCTVNNTNETN